MKIAIVGSGVAGSVAAYRLHREYGSPCSKPTVAPAAILIRT